jgi:lycopene beta-cyclase
VGGGGAGLAVLHHLALATAAGPAPRRSGTRAAGPLRVVLVDPLDRLAVRPADRTWCSWWRADDPHLASLRPAVHRSWRSVHVVGPDGADQHLDLGDLRYVMVRGEDWYAAVADAVTAATAAGGLELTHLPVAATAVTSGLDGALVRTPEADVVAATAVDSRPAPPARPGATALLQHFRGERVVQAPGAAPAVDPERAVLMDFTVPQPDVGLAFGYCLPSDARTALVEYTEFSPAVLDDAGYAAALAAYRARTVPGEVAVEHVEQGAIPMTDAPFARRAGRHAVRVGTGGGAVRPSSGYAFAAMQRQARALAGALATGAPASAPRPYPPRHAWMDGLVLRALADGSLDGAAFFPRLFARNPPERVLRFLDGASTVAEDLAMMRTAPLRPMLGAVARDARWRSRRR